MVRREVYTRFWWGNPREKDHLGDAGVNGVIILVWIFRKWYERHDLDRARSGQGQVMGTCEYGNKNSGYRNCGKFLD